MGELERPVILWTHGDVRRRVHVVGRSYGLGGWERKLDRRRHEPGDKNILRGLPQTETTVPTNDQIQ